MSRLQPHRPSRRLISKEAGRPQGRVVGASVVSPTFDAFQCFSADEEIYRGLQSFEIDVSGVDQTLDTNRRADDRLGDPEG